MHSKLQPLRAVAQLVLAISLLWPAQNAAVAGAFAVLSGHVIQPQLSKAIKLGPHPSNAQMHLAVALNSKDPAGLSNLITRLSDSSDPLYHQFLTPQQFADQFGPSQQDVDQVTQFVTSQGCSVTQVYPNRMLMDLECTTENAQKTFQVEVDDYIAGNGRVVHAVSTEPVVPAEIAGKLAGVIGLNSFAHRRGYNRRSSVRPHAGPTAHNNNSVNSYMTPANIKSVYNIASIGLNGSGETLAVAEFDGYTLSDISTYASQFSITLPTVQNVLVDGASGTPSSGADSGANEVTIDIELATAVAPGVSRLLVYEVPPLASNASVQTEDTETIDLYQRIATDNLAGEVSNSWGTSENEMDNSTLVAEENAFEQMASQGQSFFSAAGDSGAYDDSDNCNNNLEVDDPGSQQYVTSAGGTTLTQNSGVYSSETSWAATPASGTCTNGQPNAGYSPAEGGGGGISRLWSIPSWQTGLATAANFGSSSMRMVPDVALDADPGSNNTSTSFSGYPIYYTDPTDGAGFYLYGGTSCAAPIWAAYTALVNQKRVAEGIGRLGLFNAAIYPIAKSTSYSSSFHDIADGSTNLYYPATTRYDLTTGWGSMNGLGLFNALVAPSSSASPTPSASPSPTSSVEPPTAPSNLTVTVLQ